MVLRHTQPLGLTTRELGKLNMNNTVLPFLLYLDIAPPHTNISIHKCMQWFYRKKGAEIVVICKSFYGSLNSPPKPNVTPIHIWFTEETVWSNTWIVFCKLSVSLSVSIINQPIFCLSSIYIPIFIYPIIGLPLTYLAII